MNIQFIKMHGCGNDYIYIPLGTTELPFDIVAYAPRLCDRHFGIGADGVVFIVPSSEADARMRMFNPDGSEAEMCGNAIRCVAKYLVDHGHVPGPELSVATGAGVKNLTCFGASNTVESVQVDLGIPRRTPAEIPVNLNSEEVVNHPLGLVNGDVVSVTCVSMGNPHCVMVVPDVDTVDVRRVGGELEHHPIFPRRTNVEFAQVISRTELRQRTWERGTGETLACGTGAAAVCVAMHLLGHTARQVDIHLRGGTLHMDWGRDNHVYMTGPAQQVYAGSIELL